MYYTIRSEPFELKLTSNEHGKALELTSEGLCCSEGQNNGGITLCKIDFTGEGFDLSTIAPFLKKATKKGSFVVHMEDHKGEDRYVVEFGPGICEEE